MDLARSVQEVTEEVDAEDGAASRSANRADELCLAGGVALNCVGNGRLLREGPFEDLWIQPASGDAGGALGVALAIWHRYLAHDRLSREHAGTGCRQPCGMRVAHVSDAASSRRQCQGRRRRSTSTAVVARPFDPPYADGMRGSFLGPRFSSGYIEAFSTALALPTGDSRVARSRTPSRSCSPGEGRRPAAGSNGVRPSRARRTQHPWRSTFDAHAVGDEPQDQVPRKLPAVRPERAAGARPRVVRPRWRLAVPCSSSRTSSVRGSAR